jgi:hypothetical protein
VFVSDDAQSGVLHGSLRVARHEACGVAGAECQLPTRRGAGP